MAAVIYLLHCCETWFVRPWDTQLAHIVLLSKPTGGFRPIALLHSLYRVWSRARVLEVQAWAAAAPRPYFFLGQGKGTLDAAAQVMLSSEVALATDQAS
eukprot:8913055-Pyramimonas_sp.AAC.1